jgi:hypothetical protein
LGKTTGLRQINTTGNLRMAAMCELPVSGKSAAQGMRKWLVETRRLTAATAYLHCSCFTGGPVLTLISNHPDQPRKSMMLRYGLT